MISYIIGAILALSLVLWYYLIKPLTYWSDRGVPQTKPRILVGDMGDIFLGQTSMAYVKQFIYNLYPNESYVGWFNFLAPSLLLRDPELIKQVCIQDFAYFTDHKPVINPEADLLWGRNLIALNGERWKEIRNLLSPIFTTNKIKTVYKLMTETAENFVEHFNAKNENLIEIEMKGALTRYTNDVIATTAFGVKVNSLNDPENTFYSMGQIITNIGGFKRVIKALFLQAMPTICKYLGIKWLNPVAGEYFHKVIDDTIKAREENQIVRQDLVHLLLEARKDQSNTDANGKPKRVVEISNAEITSQAVIFFFAGFDTVASATSFGSYELAMNKDIQDRLREEVRQFAKNGKVNYEDLQEMKYMDMVVSEILRKWPPFPETDRLCTKPYTIQPSRKNEKPVHIKKGQEITVPIFAIQRDPKYFPNPEKFDPERFSDENKHNIVPYTNLGFGIGPRICIGNRFALIEIKALLSNLLLNFEIVTTKKTTRQPRLKNEIFQVDLQDGFHLGLKRINK